MYFLLLYLPGAGTEAEAEAAITQQVIQAVDFQPCCGTAATGAAITNCPIKVRDRNGITHDTVTDGNGKYSVDVSGMTPPFILKVTSQDGSKWLYGLATATGTANIHQFTDLMTKNFYKANASDIDTVFDNSGAIQVPTSNDIHNLEMAIRKLIGDQLDKNGLDSSRFNLITSDFDANGANFDRVLDIIKPSYNSGTVAIIPYDPVTGTAGDSIATMPDDIDLANAANPLQEAISGINTSLKNFSNTLNGKGQNLTAADLLPFYDAGYLHDGKDANSAIARQVSSMANISITSYVVKDVLSFDAANSILRFSGIATYTKNSVTYKDHIVNEDTYKKGVDGTWRIYGNRRLAHIELTAGIRKQISASGTTIQNIVPIHANAPAGTISSISVQGPSLASSPTTLNKESPASYDNSLDSFYIPNDNIVTLPPAGGSVYTFTLNKASGGTVTYKEMLPAAPVTETFSITSPLGHSLSDANLGSPLGVTWTLPTFEVSSTNLVGWMWTAGGSTCNVSGTVNSNKASGTITLPSTCNGQAVTGAGIGVHLTGNWWKNREKSVVQHLFDN